MIYFMNAFALITLLYTSFFHIRCSAIIIFSSLQIHFAEFTDRKFHIM